VTPEGLLRAAQDMLPVLRERQAACEALGRLPEETNQEFVEAGFYRILQPRRFGGCELDLPAFFNVMATIARGCPSSGWVLALTAGHAHTLASLFPEQAQIEVFGPAGEYRAPISLNGLAAAEPVSGGFRVTGGWSYVSGCEIATHFIGVAAVPGLEQRLFVVFDRADFKIVEDWDVVGMRGTGSHRVTVSDVFVPEHRTVPAALDEAGSRSAPGRTVHANPLYAAGRIGSVLWGEMAAVALGIAQGALDVYEGELRTKKVNYPPFSTRAEQADYQRHFGNAWGLVAVASATVDRVGREYMEFAHQEVEQGIPFDDRRDAQLKLLEQHATLLAADAVDLMFRTAGTSATRTGSPLQRSFRDMAMIRTHRAAQIDSGAQEFGHTVLGVAKDS
jgi:3-hydroxy-9,10-secoandrosta-1,3,5(10)-triene-9,17-dione monooxygenase